MSRDRPITVFPGPGQKGISAILEGQESATLQTRHREVLPSISEKTEMPIESEILEKAPKIPPPLLLMVNQPSAVASKLPPVRNESPWETYKPLPLPSVDRGGKVIVAYSNNPPVKMVSIRERSSGLRSPAPSRHKNLLAVLEVFRHDGARFIVTEYAAASLKSLITVPMPFEERHVSATCRQGGSSSYLASHIANNLQVFEGMMHLSRFGLAHRKLDTSKVLFFPERSPDESGLVKLVHFDECEVTSSGTADPLRLIALEMMNKNRLPETDQDLSLQDPQAWSSEARNFLEIASWSTLDNLKDNKFLNKDISPTVMVPFVEYVLLCTLEVPHQMKM